MDGLIWYMCIFLAVVFIAFFVLTFVPYFATWSAYRHSVLIGVDLPSRLQPAVSARLMASARGAVLGGALFAIAATIAGYLNLDDNDNPQSVLWLFLGAVIAGGSVGTAVAAFTGSRTISSDLPRVARSGAVTVADYMFPFERIGARVMVFLAIVAAIAAALVAESPVFPIAFFATLGVITLVLFEVASRRVVDRSQPAGSTGELVWDDAIRALILRDMLIAPLTLGTLALFIGIVQLIGHGSGLGMVTLTGLIPSLVILLVSLYSRASRSQRYFVTRLWPNLRWSDTADEEVDAV